VVLSRRSKAVPPDETGVPGADPDPVPGAVPGVPVITSLLQVFVPARYKFVPRTHLYILYRCTYCHVGRRSGSGPGRGSGRACDYRERVLY